MRTVGLSLIAGACLMAATAASADEVRLGDQELDAVTAGLDLGFEPSDFRLTSSPLLRIGATAVLFGLDDPETIEFDQPGIVQVYAAQNGGASITGDPTLGPVAISLFNFASPSDGFAFDLPFGLTQP